MSLARHPSLRCALAALAALACSSGPEKEPIACQSDLDCPSEAKCVLGACVAGSLPQAKIVVRATAAELVSNRLITFDGSQSQDTNPGGSLRRYAWAVSHPAGTACDPSARTGDAATFSTIFQCSGQYLVELTVTNDVGLQSLPQQAQLTIAQALDAPAVTSMGASLAAGHRCEGSPLICKALDGGGGASFQLAVAATDEQDANLGYSWTYQAPAGVDPAKTRVTFEPGPDTPTPVVRIETDGTAIAGDWIFQARVTDSDHLTSFGEQKLSVGNTPPAVALQGPTVLLPHTFIAPVDRYLASATLHGVVSDPDGDAIASGDLTLLESAQNACSFQVTSSSLSGGQFTASVELSCPGASPSDLIGPVTRQLAFKGTDVNGDAGTDTRPLQVTNASPALVWSGGAVAGTYTVPHTTAPCPAGAPDLVCFAVAAALPYAVSDTPENDPVALALAPTGVPTGTFFAASPSGRGFTWLVPVTKATLLRAPSGASPVTIQVAAGDPFTGQNPTTASFGLAVANTAPVVTSLGALSVAHAYSATDRAFRASFEVASAADADGDPLTPSASSSDGACSATGLAGGRIQVSCAWAYDPAGGALPPLASVVFGARTVIASAADPWTSSPATAPASLAVTNRGPTIGTVVSSLDAVGACTCNVRTCSIIPNGPGTVVFDPGAADADGDPLHLTITFGSGAPPVDKLCRGADCGVAFASGNDTATVRLSDGVLDATRTYQIVRTCDETLPCGPPPGGCP